MTAPALHLVVQYTNRAMCPDRSQVRRWVQAARDEAEIESPVQLLLRFVAASEARILNRQYRHNDYATNVLTFCYPDPAQITADIVVCSSVVKTEARSQKKKVMDHYAHMIVHGVLHAFGMDHDAPRSAHTMERLEGTILARFDIDDPYVETRIARSRHRP